jgi:acetoin utilization deacetylase AcuC-like enzyme
VYKLNDNINYALDIANNLKKGIEFRGKFNFPQKIKFFTGIFYNLNCIQHIKLPEEPLKHIMTRISLFENSDRLSMLIDNENGVVLNEQVLHYIEGISYEDKINKTADNSACENVIFYESQRKCCVNDILKCHDINYIQKLKEMCHIKSNNTSQKKQENHQNQTHEKGINAPKILSNLYSSNPIYKNISSINYQSHFRKLDIDTYVNEYSFENIFNTSGCVLDAIDYIFNDKIKNALVLIRPPGHNAGYYGPVENGNTISTGFCLVNNIAIGAAYAKYKYRNEISKIAIFDFDLHHGNGTEEIVQMLNSKIFEKKFCYDKLCELKTRNFKQINWVDFDDAKNVLYISTHIYEEENEKNNNIYPFSGGVESNTDKKSPIYPGGIYNIPLIINKDKKNFTREEYRNIIKTKVIPRLYEFKPDLIFLSAGFDCHENEIINQNYINLNEFDFSFITQQMQFVANKFCEGRLISVLEGGYNIATSITSSFAQSVLAHAKFLSLSLNMFQIFDVKLTGFKRQPQIKDEDNNIDSKNINKESNENIDDDENKEKSKEKEYKEEEKENKECEKEIKENGNNNKEEKENTREEAVKEDNE